jgi:hypothetical protein
VEQAVHSSGQTASAVVLALPGGAGLELNDINQVALAAALLRALAKPC